MALEKVKKFSDWINFNLFQIQINTTENKRSALE